MMDKKKEIQGIVVSDEEQGYITPPDAIQDWIDSRAADHRIPRTAIARHVSNEWRRQVAQKQAEQALGIQPDIVRRWGQREDDLRASHYPSAWGLGFIPRPADLPSGTWKPSLMLTACYTSLNVPRPFDPSFSASGTSMAGSGWGYMRKDGFPAAEGTTSRRGGGVRGGFAFTTGPLSGNQYPSAIMPAQQFNLGNIGFSNGGHNPEGLVYTDRPKTMLLTGLRNAWAHEVYFVRSRVVMHRNLYGPISRTTETPQAPTVILNGITPLSGIVSIDCQSTTNAPRELSIVVNSPHGQRAGEVQVNDTVQVFASPRRWADPPLVFTGFVSNITSDSSSLRITCLDPLGYLALEPITVEPQFFEADVLHVIRDIIAGSTYPLFIDRVVAESRVRIKEDIELLHKTRLDAIQTLLDLINHTPRRLRLWADVNGRLNITLQADPATATYGYRVGSSVDGVGDGMASATTTADLWPTDITTSDSSAETYNVVSIINDEHNVSITRPRTTDANYPLNPVHRVFKDDSAKTNELAELIAEQRLKTQGWSQRSWRITGRPERFDIMPGEVIDVDSHIADSHGKHSIQDVRWSLTPSSVSMTIQTGRPDPSMLGVLRLTVGQSL